VALCALRGYLIWIVQRAFRYRFYPTPEQELLLRRTIGCVRLVYNKALAERSAAWHERKERVGFAATARALTAWKREPALAFLCEVSCVPLQQALRHLDRAYTNFFQKRAAHPSYKRKHSGGSATFTRSGFSWDGAELRLAKMTEALPVRWSRSLPHDADPSSVTVSLDAAGRWHVSMLCEDRVAPLPPVAATIGVDVGLTHLVTLSTGEKVDNPRHDSRELARKRRLSRSLSRKQKGSKNSAKARRKLARLHARVSDRRKDHLHKLSTRLVRENQTIVVEDLNVVGMVQNRSLARAISDAGWSALIAMIEYKCAWYGRELVKVARFYPSSKTCNACGGRVQSLPLSAREWACDACGVLHDRDVNAALNLLAAGHAVTACGPGVSHRISDPLQPGLKQEAPGVS
jgi:putative transposase